MSISTPIALLIFNRPKLTEIVFESIAKVKPKKLLVVADGPRFPEEEEKCQKARAAVMDNIDWECEVLTNFSDKNLGCKYRVSSGLDWVFSEVEEAIILEDDCLPTSSFFYFCQILLEHYRDDERIMMITGNNFQAGQSRTEYSYFFAKETHIWGWASWRRAWKYYDVEIRTWPEYQKLNFIESVINDPYEQRYWTNIFNQVFQGNIDTWDYQWTYTCWCQNGLAIIPDCNLVSNIGFGEDATHTKANSPYAQIPTTDIWEITHPKLVIRNKVAEAYTFDNVFGGREIRQDDTIKGKIRQRINGIKRRFNVLSRMLRNSKDGLP